MDRELERRLRGTREPAPPPDLADRLERAIPARFVETRRGWLRAPAWTPARIALAASVPVALGVALWFALGLLSGSSVVPPAYAALLEPVAQATGDARAVHLVFMVLAREGDNLSYVNLEGPLLRVEFWEQKPRIPGDRGRLRIDYPGRQHAFDGEKSVTWYPERNEAYPWAGWHDVLAAVTPRAWLDGLTHRPAEGVEVLAHEETGDSARLMLREQGADTTPRAPAFVGEFDRETEIVWNRDSKRLVGFRRWILHEGRRVLQAELASIEYLTELPEERFRIALPPDVRWGGELAALTDEERSLGPREVAAQIFRAAADGDRTTLEKYIDSPSLIDTILDVRPIELVYLGEPYRAANYGGVLIPYEVRCGLFGWTKRGELAIRNDNDEQRWEVDGGI